jgi:hypothetical protein
MIVWDKELVGTVLVCLALGAPQMARGLDDAPRKADLLESGSASETQQTEAEPGTEKAVSDETPKEPPKPQEKLQIHAYATQAFATTDGNQLHGIPGSGTTNYRTLAVQLRYGWTERDAFVIQLDHESLGESPLQEFHDEIEIDWVFYERQLTTATDLKVGRMPLPFGIYNEIRDVGTLLPFFRPPATVYNEGRFATESLDGLVLSQRFGAASPWNLDADLYYGGYEFIEAGGRDPGIARGDDVVGAQLWLNTPASGLRVGLGANTALINRAGDPPDVTTRWDNYIVSLDGDFSRFLVRGEYRDLSFEGGSYRAYFGQVGFYPTRRLKVFLQAERSELTASIPFVGTFEADLEDDVALGVSFAFRYDLVLKGEVHRSDGLEVEDQPVDVLGPTLETDYGIVSLSFTF